MTAGFFITGTDTGVGKTYVSELLINTFCRCGYAALGMKPVASGGTVRGDRWVNEDALRLQAQACVPAAYDVVNPYVFEPAIAPHLAASEAGEVILADVIAAAYRELAAKAQCVVVEGVGGWAVPINETQTMADVARALNLPVVLVVGVRLGCLNHALLTAQAIDAAGLRLAGWVANRIDPHCARADENVNALLERLAAPLLGDLAYQPPGQGVDPTQNKVDIEHLINQASS